MFELDSTGDFYYSSFSTEGAFHLVFEDLEMDHIEADAIKLEMHARI